MSEQKKADKLPMKMKMGWSSSGFSLSFSFVMISYLSMYATDVMGLGVGAVGMILMASKIFDGITDVIVGFLIDKTHTRFGKARPYALAVVPYWLCIGLLFTAPNLGDTGNLIYLFVMYTLANSIFGTFYFCSEAPYMANALEDSGKSLGLIAFSGIISTVGGLAGGIFVPLVIGAAGSDPAAWSRMTWMMAVPLALIGCFRFLLVKELNVSQAASPEESGEKKSLKEILKLLVHNKYIFMVAALVLISYLSTGLTNAVATYYNKYIIGNVEAGSLLALAMLPLIAVMVLVPVLAKKFSLKKVINTLMVIGLAGSLLRLLNPSSLGLTFLSTCLAGVSFQTYYGFANSQVIECMDYGEWKNGGRVEGILASATSVMNKIGNGLGVALTGFLMAMAGYDGRLDVQPASAETMMIAIATVVPAVFTVIFLLIFRKYDLESRMEEIHAELERRKEGECRRI